MSGCLNISDATFGDWVKWSPLSVSLVKMHFNLCISNL